MVSEVAKPPLPICSPELGATIIDTDLIAHQVTALNGPAITAIVDRFGEDMLDTDGAFGTQKCANWCSNNPKHAASSGDFAPIIRQECERQALVGGGSYPIFVVPLLYESGTWAERLTRILVVDCEEETQIQRVMAKWLLRQQVEDILLIQATMRRAPQYCPRRDQF